MTLTAKESLDMMRAASKTFYNMAIRTDCHAFIEFTGLMNEYIKICEENLTNGIDFRNSNAHIGKSQEMKIQPYEVNYLNEKLYCIFQGLIVVEGVKPNG
ncbi:hypothetical protein [Microcoleus sp.]|uniref:hypothetical protein n=1 Tax=Microcoleus sp. TaxID=44472 RepID=UPI00403EF51D